MKSLKCRIPGSLARLAQTWPLAFFFALAYVWSWMTWVAVPRLVWQHGLGWKFDTFDITLIVVGACGPTVAALFTQWLGHGNLNICAVWTGLTSEGNVKRITRPV